MMIQGFGNKSSLDSGSSKDENNDNMNNGKSGDGLVVCWNKFLPFRSLKVLVVENDDSTRHVVTALLKKSGYEVIAVANGLQAWKILEDRNNHVDIVLTEVVLPYLTGLGLLRTIMNHEKHKNLPVIMMSPSDSLGIVFKCLSKGATDFLVKPIRKNELRTLWQHVWRKRHAVSGGGSVPESDVVTRSMVPVKSPETGKSGSSSNNGDDNETNGINNGSHDPSYKNGSDQGSGTQRASKDNRKAKADLTASAAGQLTSPPMHNWDLNHLAGELEGNSTGDKTLGRELASKVPENQNSKLKPSSKKLPETKASLRGKTVQEYTSKDNGHSGEQMFEISKNALGNDMNKNGDGHLREGSEVCFQEVGSKRSEGGKRNGGKAARQRSVLGHSSHSAFSRYGSVLKVPPKVQGINEGSSCSPLEDGSKGANDEDEPYHKYQGNCGGTTTDHDSDNSRKAYDIGLNDTVGNPQGCKYKQPINPNSVQPAKRSYTSGEPVSKDPNASGDKTHDLPEQNPHIQMPHHYHPYHHMQYYGQNHNMQQSLTVSNHGDSTMNDVQQLQPPYPGHNANTFGVNPMTDAGIVYGFMNGIAANRQLQRMAAIHKFRQKRKDRCFNKKVRYESRKITADQRPRMKGQFVRRTDISNNTGPHFC